MRIFFFIIATIVVVSCNNKKTVTNDSMVMEADDSSDKIKINPDSVQYCFVFMGCNRVESADTTNNPSTANLPELQKTFDDIAKLNPKPVFYFFLGDLVYGLDTNLTHLSNQLIGWNNLYKSSPIYNSGIQLVAIPGNHEMLYEVKNSPKDSSELPNNGALSVWMKEMKQYVPNLPINRADTLNNQMTYSFNYNNTHFILLNTDTYNDSSVIGVAPADWINADIVAARKDTSIKHIFILGHKPAVVTKKLEKADGDKIMDISVVKAIWKTMEDNQVEAMLSAHSHQYFRTQPKEGKTYQVIAGNGGSRYEGDIKDIDSLQFFGYSIVYIMKNQQVILKSKGRSIPYKSYDENIPGSVHTKTRDEAEISWGTNSGTWGMPDDKKKK